jgi:transposase
MNKYAKNHRPAALHEFRGQPMTCEQIAKTLGVSFSCVSRRIKAGTPLDRPSQSPTRRDWHDDSDSYY